MQLAAIGVAREIFVAETVDDEQHEIFHRGGKRKISQRCMQRFAAARSNYRSDQIDQAAAVVVGSHAGILGVESRIPIRGFRHAARSTSPRRYSDSRRRLAAT